MTAALELAAVLLAGRIAGAELGSWCCVQPVVARLPYERGRQSYFRAFATFIS
jgi:hypothetical protein